MTDNTGQQAAIDVPPAPATGDNASRHFAWAVDAPPAVAQVVRPRAAYPPPELAGIPQRDAEAWGEPFSDDGHELVRVADLVRLHASRSGRQAMRVVAGEVLDALQADGACRFYWLRPGETGLKIHNDEWLMPDTYPGRQYDPVRSSWLPTLECLRWCWVTAATGFAALDAGPHAAVAVRVFDAVRVFGVAVAAAVPSPGFAVANAAPVLVHKQGSVWTTVERDDIFRMRHKERMTDEAIGLRIGQKHQRVSQLIGSGDAWKHGDSMPKAWNPSAALLKECGLSLQPLQTVATALAGA